MDSDRRLSVKEAAEALGVSEDTIRRGITRGSGPFGDLLRDRGIRTDDGRWMVRLADADVERHARPALRRIRLGVHTLTDEPVAPQRPAADATVFRQRIAELEAELKSLRDENATGNERLARSHAAELERLQDVH